MPEQDQRRLAAIMFTDLVGYSSITERDEALALALLREHTELVELQINAHAGRKIKSTGDGFMIEFASAIQAVECSLAIQKAMRQMNAAKPPDRQLLARIGIHVGDVVYHDGDVLGDGVNLAARIEPLAEPGGICISRQVYDQVRKKIDVQFVSLGPQKLKNIEESLDIFKVLIPGEFAPQISVQVGKPAGQRRILRAAALVVVALALLGSAGWYFFWRDTPPAESLALSTEASPRIESIAVLPFENLSTSAEDEYFSDGMTEEILSALSQVDGLKVISRTSVFSLKNQNLDSKTIGQRLNVNHLLEGSVRRSGDQVRISVELVDIERDRPIWRETYERTMSDIFKVQDEISRKIVEQLKLNFMNPSGSAVAVQPQEDQQAYENYLKGRYFWNKRTGEGFQQARNYYIQAIQIDPEYAKAYAGLADTYSLMGIYGHLDIDVAYAEAKKAAEKALEISPDQAEALVSLAYVTQNDPVKFDRVRAEELFKRALKLNPNYTTAHHWYALLLGDLKRFDEALEQGRQAVQLDPLSPILNVMVGSLNLTAKNYGEARKWVQNALELDPKFVNAHQTLVEIEIAERHFEKAESAAEKLVELNPDDIRSHLALAYAQEVNWKWSEADQTLAKAIEMEVADPLRAQAQVEHADLLNTMGRFDESLRQLDLARPVLAHAPELDFVYVIKAAQSILYRRAGPQSELVSTLRRSVESAGSQPLSMAILNVLDAYYATMAGDFQRALTLMDEADGLIAGRSEDVFGGLESVQVAIKGSRAYILGARGEKEQSQTLIDELAGRESLPGVYYWIATAYMMQGDLDKAFEWMQKGIDERDTDLALIAWDPLWDRAKSDARFEAMLKQMNMQSFLSSIK